MTSSDADGNSRRHLAGAMVTTTAFQNISKPLEFNEQKRSADAIDMKSPVELDKRRRKRFVCVFNESMWDPHLRTPPIIMSDNP